MSTLKGISIQIKRGADSSLSNTVLQDGELGYSTEGKLKIGNGIDK